MYALPAAARLGVDSSIFGWSLCSSVPGTDSLLPALSTPFPLEAVVLSHLLLSGLLILSAFWHWCYWDLDVFVSSTSGTLVLDLLRVFGIHLTLASLLCFSFGAFHLTGFFGPGLWSSDSAALIGSIRILKPAYSLVALTPASYGAIPAHHLLAGLFGLFASVWHLSARPAPILFSLFAMDSLETVLASSNLIPFVASLVTSSLMWYGSVHNSLELNGPTRYTWDNSYFSIALTSRASSSSWYSVPDRLLLYDYLGSNPAKGGLFRTGPIFKSDGIISSWLGHPTFMYGVSPLTVRRMPAFFETFPVILLDQTGAVQADIAFRRSSSSFSIEQRHITLSFTAGILSRSDFSSASLVKSYARKTQLGTLFAFSSTSSALADGVFRTSIRGWYSFSHLTLSLLFWFGHLWHSARALYRAFWTGLPSGGPSSLSSSYGLSERIGDARSLSNSVLL
jgi:photosystem II CP47 chlorophyll apoprotein